MARAWRAGLRPRSRWWTLALFAIVAAQWASADAEVLREGLAQWWGLAAQGQVDLSRLAAIGVWLGVFPAVAVMAAVFATGFAGALGPIRPREREKVTPTRPWLGPGPLVVVLVIMGLAVATLGSVVAGAARSVDASEPALVELWQTWAVRVIGGTAAILLVGGAAEWWLARRTVRRSLYRTVSQVRRDEREGPRR